MTDYDHNAFVSTHEDLECENPYNYPGAWDWDDYDNYDDYDHHREILYWWH